MNDFLFELPLPVIFDFAICLDYMERSALECLYIVDHEGVNRLVELGGITVLIRLTVPEGGFMQVNLLQGAVPSREEQAKLALYIRDWFDLDRDLAPFYSLSSRDSLLRPLVERFYGLRIVGIPDLFEALCWAILGQQVNLTFAYRLKQRLTAEYGESVEWAGHTYYRFPRPEVFLGVSMEELCALQLTRNKALAILTVAGLMARGELSREELLQLPSPEEAEARLVKIRGIGPWTAQYVRMRCLRDTTSFPVGDVGLQNAVKALMGMDRKPTLAELQQLGEGWQGWEAYATFYLWRALY